MRLVPSRERAVQVLAIQLRLFCVSSRVPSTAEYVPVPDAVIVFSLVRYRRSSPTKANATV